MLPYCSTVVTHMRIHPLCTCTRLRVYTNESAQHTDKCLRWKTKQANRKLAIMQKRGGNNNGASKYQKIKCAFVKIKSHLVTQNETNEAGCWSFQSNDILMRPMWSKIEWHIFTYRFGHKQLCCSGYKHAQNHIYTNSSHIPQYAKIIFIEWNNTE